jgi:hypothetical protein
MLVVDEVQLLAPAVAGEVSDQARKLSLGESMAVKQHLRLQNTQARPKKAESLIDEK